jgi:hypothetical protein
MSFVISCRKDDSNPPKPIPPSTQIVLNDLNITADSVTLTWSKLDTVKFSCYLIVRKDEKGITVDPNILPNQYIITRIYDQNTTSYVDKNIPVTPYLEYQVIGLVTNSYIYSNTKTYERPEIKTFSFNILDVIPDLSNNRFYFVEKDKLIDRNHTCQVTFNL